MMLTYEETCKVWGWFCVQPSEIQTSKVEEMLELMGLVSTHPTGDVLTYPDTDVSFLKVKDIARWRLTRDVLYREDLHPACRS